METSLEVSTELNRELLNDPVIPRLGIFKESVPSHRATRTPMFNAVCAQRQRNWISLDAHQQESEKGTQTHSGFSSAITKTEIHGKTMELENTT